MSRWLANTCPVRAAAAILLSLALSGCASMQVPRIDPSGERIFVPQGVPVAAAPGVPAAVVAAPGLTLIPSRIVAPVGSEVLMVAGLQIPGAPNLAGQRVEWMLAPGSVGHFLAVGESEQPRFLRFTTPPQKMSNDYAVSETQATARIITRGTADPRDDVAVLPGQAWITVASPVEGASHVTSFAPDVQGVIANRQSAVIHWVDARWTAPVSATVPLGSKHSLVTCVTRATGGTPVSGYKVRYEVVNGSDAGFGPALSGGVELTTNEAGQASAEISQRASASATAQVNVQLIRPAGVAAGVNEPLVLGSTTVAIHWGDVTATQPGTSTIVPGATVSPAPGSLLAPGTPPATAGTTTPGAGTATTGLDVRIVSPVRPIEVGAQAEFELHITNRTTASLKNVTVHDRFGSALEHAVAASPIKRTIGELAPGQTRAIGLTFKVRQPGRHCHTAEVTADGGLRASAEGCVTATGVAAEAEKPSISLKKIGPRQMKVNETALFKIEIANTGTQPIPSLRVSDSWRGGLRPLQATDGNTRTKADEITWEYKTPIAPGAKVLFEVEYQAVGPQPSTCTRATVSGPDDLLVADEVCVEIAGAATAAQMPAAQPQRRLAVLISDRTDPVPAGTPYTYRIVVRNDGAVAEENVVLSVEVPDALVIELVEAQVEKFRIDGNTIHFDPILLLEPSKLVSYELRVKAKRAGSAVIRGSATSEAIAAPITAEHDTRILPGG